MSMIENVHDVERSGRVELEEELCKARIELEKSQAVVDALTSVLARMNEGRRDEKPKTPQPKSPKSPEQKPSSPTENWLGGGSIVDDFRRFGKFVARLWRRKPEPTPPPKPPMPPAQKPSSPTLAQDGNTLKKGR